MADDRTRQKKAARRQANKKQREQEVGELASVEQRIAQDAPARGTTPLASASAPKRFSELPLSQKTQRGLKAAGYSRMTAIQRASLPHALAGRDVLGSAKTGSGKTLAFLVPVLECLWRNKWTASDGLGALVLSPTRELAAQTFAVLRSIGREHKALSAGLLIGGGGASRVKSEARHVARMSILVCTPGRLLQHLEATPNFTCDTVCMLVLDEADQMLELGFKKQLDAIVGSLPPSSVRQTLLFSATASASLSQLARLALSEPEYLNVHAESASATPSTLQQFCMTCPAEGKLDLLWSFLRSHTQQKLLIFVSAQKQVRFLFEALRRLRPGVPLLQLHGRLGQRARTETCAKFHTATTGAAMIATDVAARGLDFSHVDWVVQLDCPESVETYQHRVGRTARMKAKGASLLVLLPEEAPFLDKLKAKKMEVTHLEANPSRLASIQPQLQALLVKEDSMRLLAQKAVRAYVKALNLARLVDPRTIALDQFALSLGLATKPVVQSTGKHESKETRIHRERTEAAQALVGDDDDGKVRLRPAPSTRTHVEKLLHRKPQKSLGSDALAMLDDGSESGDEDILVRKANPRHLQNIDALAPAPAPALKPKKRRRVLPDNEALPTEERPGGEYYAQAAQEVAEHDAEDRRVLKDRLHKKRQARKHYEQMKERERHGDERGPLVTIGPEGDSVDDGVMARSDEASSGEDEHRARKRSRYKEDSDDESSDEESSEGAPLSKKRRAAPALKAPPSKRHKKH